MDTEQMRRIRRLDQKLETYANIALHISELSAASTKKVGCIAIRKDFSKIASFGYNGSYPGANVYEATGTIEESLEPGQSGLIHAELNMIAKFHEADPENYIVILTLSPCKECTKILCTAGFKHVYWIEEYRERAHLDIFDKCEVTYGLIQDLQKDYHPKII
jgi:deoxycytidylate deaminase